MQDFGRTPRMLRRLMLLAILGLGLPACATITTGTSHSLTVITEPPGAVCELRRSDNIIGVVNPTPGTVRISKSSREIAVRCNRDGLPEAVATVQPGFQAMTAANLLLGGLIGIAVDAASGAAGTYPSSITVAMVAPGGGTMPSEDMLRIDARIEALRSVCSPAERARCDEQIRALEIERQQRGTPTS
ncbi:hypothetical protein AAFN86_22925 [Roseomonas sp. CAU 1739]|uniref:hypothetical protein n=1 Tax=Roseomonas sp. CAU 1739 TaxID=3140364 RepID=UPI00325BCB43